MATGYDLDDFCVQRILADATVAWSRGDADRTAVEELDLSGKLVGVVEGVGSHLGRTQTWYEWTSKAWKSG